MIRLFIFLTTASIGSFLVGCNNAPTLDTSTRTEIGTFQISEFTSGWIATDDQIEYSSTWRFISHTNQKNGNIAVDVGYKMKIKNPTDRIVKFSLIKFKFLDEIGITIAEGKCKDVFTMSEGMEKNRTGTFSFHVNSLSTLNLIVSMRPFASVKNQ